ncbi:MAG: hypothetical protein IJ357_05580 [Oscillospiraceae bacterium]|nr:hypothetical protein [Oscillospiraceae bacterium]
MANEVELLVSKEKFDNRVSTLEGCLRVLQGLATEYGELKDSASDIFDEDQEKVTTTQKLVEEYIIRVNSSIEATQKAIQTLNDTSTKFEDTSTHVTQALEDAINLAKNLFT